MLSYWHFTRANLRILAFGFLMAFLSGPGQTHFIGIFGPSIQQDFSLTTASWGQLYMLATLLSAALLSWSGSLIDRFNINAFAITSLLGLALACFAISQIPAVGWMLVLVVFGLRQFGQGLISHTSQTAMVRAFKHQRGKALALTAIGYTLGEALLPALAWLGIQQIGWRATYYTTALLVLLFVPIVWWLVNNTSRNIQPSETLEQTPAPHDTLAQSQFSRAQVLRDPRFYLLIPTVMTPSLVITALFFFPAQLALAKDWPMQWVSGHYWLFSLVTVATSIYSGVLIDRLGAKKVILALLAPLALSLLTLAVWDSYLSLLCYMVLLGFGSGLNYTVGSAFWAELYGTQHFGAIKSMISTISVFASALGPPLVGGLLSAGYTFETICVLLVLGMVVVFGLMLLALRLPEPA